MTTSTQCVGTRILILMADGSNKPLDEVQVGDRLANGQLVCDAELVRRRFSMLDTANSADAAAGVVSFKDQLMKLHYRHYAWGWAPEGMPKLKTTPYLIDRHRRFGIQEQATADNHCISKVRQRRALEGYCPDCGAEGALAPLGDWGGALCPTHGRYQMITAQPVGRVVDDPEHFFTLETSGEFTADAQVTITTVTGRVAVVPDTLGPVPQHSHLYAWSYGDGGWVKKDTEKPAQELIEKAAAPPTLTIVLGSGAQRWAEQHPECKVLLPHPTSWQGWERFWSDHLAAGGGAGVLLFGNLTQPYQVPTHRLLEEASRVLVVDDQGQVVNVIKDREEKPAQELIEKAAAKQRAAQFADKVMPVLEELKATGLLPRQQVPSHFLDNKRVDLALAQMHLVKRVGEREPLTPARVGQAFNKVERSNYTVFQIACNPQDEYVWHEEAFKNIVDWYPTNQEGRVWGASIQVTPHVPAGTILCIGMTERPPTECTNSAGVPNWFSVLHVDFVGQIQWEKEQSPGGE